MKREMKLFFRAALHSPDPITRIWKRITFAMGCIAVADALALAVTLSIVA